MKAIRVKEIGGPEVLKLEEVPIPKPEAGQVLVKVQSVGVNPVETYQRSGTNEYKLSTFPWTPGHDGAGVIEEVGKDVSDFKAGDRVYITSAITGSYAQYALCNATSVQRLPSNISFDQGAAVSGPYGTAYHTLFHRANLKAKQTVLVHGASGGVGIAATQFAKAHGAIVIGTAGTKEGSDLVKKQGADFVLNHRTENYLKELENITGGKGVDCIVEMLANVNLDKDLKALAVGGVVLIVGSRGNIEITPRDTMAKRSDIRGVSFRNITPTEKQELFTAIGEGLEKGTLNPIVGKHFSLADAAKAHHEVISPSSGAYGKIVLHPWE